MARRSIGNTWAIGPKPTHRQDGNRLREAKSVAGWDVTVSSQPNHPPIPESWRASRLVPRSEPVYQRGSARRRYGKLRGTGWAQYESMAEEEQHPLIVQIVSYSEWSTHDDDRDARVRYQRETDVRTTACESLPTTADGRQARPLAGHGCQGRQYPGSADKVTRSEVKEASVGTALSYDITGLVARRSPTASETMLDRSVICKVGNGLDDVHDLLRQPAAADGGHCSPIHLDSYGEVFDYQGVHFDAPRAN
ncbi:hypothetical protein AWB66_05989 [Caballeronia telluris]|uniref:Uncharacterized protein n=1 Tax=Caballeronia telluris TaxID=326475 RepID=A0A158KDC6_9BURK|nr:hypothetical protein AWB66_05989 [Caballeronia telluris]